MNLKIGSIVRFCVLMKKQKIILMKSGVWEIVPPHLLPPQNKIRRLILFTVFYSSFTWLTIHSILYNIYINIRVSDKIFILSRPPTYINELRKKPPCTSLQRVVKFFSNIKNILEPVQDITLIQIYPVHHCRYPYNSDYDNN